MILTYLGATIIFSAVLGLAAWQLFIRYAPLIKNFQKREVRVSYGIFIAALAVAGGIGAWISGAAGDERAAGYLVMVIAFAGLGFWDDSRGTHGQGGFRGHFRELLRGRFTTGAAKAIGGGAAAAVGVWLISGREMSWEVLLQALVVALSANFLNLLDLRPGRAGWAFVVLWCLLIAVRPAREALALTAPAALAAAVLLPADMRAQWIMGDSGSNLAGAVLGVILVLTFSRSALLAVLLALIIVHIYAERCSISSAIERNRILSALDKKLGVR